jgi:hypothetical protein
MLKEFLGSIYFWGGLIAIGLGIKIGYDYKIDNAIFIQSPDDILVYVNNVVCKNTRKIRHNSYLEFTYNDKLQRIYITEQECKTFKPDIYLKVYHLEDYEDRFLFKKPPKSRWYFSLSTAIAGILILSYYFLLKTLLRGKS